MTAHKSLRIGTRASALAQTQARLVRDSIAQHCGLDAEIVAISTTGDEMQSQRLSEIGGKGLFTKEIEQALALGEIDLAVHSMKDVATATPDALDFAAILQRGDPRDVWIDREGRPFKDLPSGATVGTAGLRRQAQILHKRPDLKVKLLRGNVETRLRKLMAGEVDATLLALAGLKRLGKADVATEIFDVDAFLPAVSQGAIGLQIRAEDHRMRDLLAPLNSVETATCIAAERSLLACLDGSCRTPIAAFAVLTDEGLLLKGLLASSNGTILLRDQISGPSCNAIEMGMELGSSLKGRVPEGAVLWDV